MSFKVWLEQNDLAVIPKGSAIFVDLDNTLVHSMDEEDMPRLSSPRLDEHLRSMPHGCVGGERFVVSIRPGAVEFLRSLNRLGDVFILSMGTQPYVTAVQEVVHFPVQHAWSARELPPGSLGKACQIWREDEQVRPFVLIDNLDAAHGFTRIKLNIIGFDPFQGDTGDCFQLVPTWECRDESDLDDRGLSPVISRVQAKLNRQRKDLHSSTTCS